MNMIQHISHLLRRVVLVALLVGLLVVGGNSALADSAPGAPENPAEKQKTLYEGKRNVVVSEGEPAKPNRSTNAHYVDSQGREVDQPKDNNQSRAKQAADDSTNIKNSRNYGHPVD
ncbi:hypothetical protein ACKFKG_19515 [Phormidesmis sp. 146-35]